MSNNISDRLSNLSPRKLAILSKQLQAKTEQVRQELPIPRRAQSGPCPLSFAQQRLWFLDQVEPGSPVYNVPTGVRLRGRLDADALRRTLSEVVRRHEVLRTTFAAEAGKPRQHIHAPHPVALPVTDLSKLPADEREAEARRITTEEARQPFDLSRDSMLRARLLRLGDEEHVALLTLHHIASDGWSMGVLVREVAALYTAYSRGQDSPLAEPPVQYADYAVWQRELLQGEVLEAQLSYWRERLAGVEPLELPTDKPRPPVRSHKGAVERLSIGRELTASLRALCREEGVTPFMLLLAGFKALLHRYTGRQDIVVGTPVAGRGRVELEVLIGFFVNTLVLRTEVSGGESFRELLRRVRDVSLGAFAHQEVPFERLVDELSPERDLSRHPLFQTTFVLQNAAEDVLELPGLSLSSFNSSDNSAKFDLTLYAIESADELSFSLDYSTDLFEAETMRRLLSHYARLLASASSSPDAPLAELELLGADERRRLLQLSAGSPAPAEPVAHTIHEWFALQAAATPDAHALTDGRRHLTYAELDACSSRLASRLRRRGLGAEAVVAVLLERSAELVISLLGVLKAGAAYLPLDPRYPAARLSFMLEDSGARALVTQRELEGVLPAAGLPVLFVGADEAQDAEDGEGAAGQDVAEEAVAAPANLAYVIYTSGSTGTPKGVGVTHHNVTRLLTAAQPLFSFSPEDTWALFHSAAFDFSVWELWGALLTGGRLVVVPFWESREPEAVWRLVQKERVSVLNQTPSAFAQLMAAALSAGGEGAGAEAGAGALRLVVFGGEALDFAALSPWLARFGTQRPRLVNMYGITETTVHVTHRQVGSGESGGSRIGVALGDLSAYVLDPRGQLSPEGVVGELYVSGEGVARGYLGRAALTAERFVPDPYSGEAGARMYRSGDLARWVGGELEYLGRGDGQVKVRGHRIELGEVESAVRLCAGVRECAVVARAEEQGGQRLVAYFVAEEEVRAGELREQVRGRLPEYMVPAAFVRLVALPLTVNGKLDRKALPEPREGREATGDAYVAPRNEVESSIAAIWQEVLGLEQVGVNDNFFDLGGDSILSVQITARANQAGLRLTPRDIFIHQTVAALAEAAGDGVAAREPAELDLDEEGLRRLLAQAGADFGAAPGEWLDAAELELDAMASELEGASSESARAGARTYEPSDFPLAGLDRETLGRVLGQASDVEDIYPLSPMQQGMLFHSAISPESAAFVAQTVSPLPGNLRPRYFREACQQVVNRHTILRTSFYWEGGGGEPLQVVRRSVTLPWLEEDWRGSSEEEWRARFERFLAEDQERGLDVQRAPLMRCALIRVSDELYQFVWTTHHLLLDGWSLTLVLSEVFDLYAKLYRGRPPGLPRPRPYRDYIAWLRRQDSSGAAEFWRRALAGFKEPTPLPTKKTAQAAAEPLYRERRASLGEAETRELAAFARRQQLTLNTVTQGAWALLLGRHSGEEDVVFGATAAGRPAELAGVEEMVGLFINTLPVRARFRPDESLAPWLRRLQGEQAESRQYEHTPLVEVQGWSEVARRLPLFESNLVFMNLPGAAGAAEKGAAARKEPQAGPRPEPANEAVVRSKTPTNFPLTLKAAAGARLELELLYDANRFDDETVERLLEQLKVILANMPERAEAGVGALQELAARVGAAGRPEPSKARRAGFASRKFMSVKPKAVDLSARGLVRAEPLREGEPLPLALLPGADDIDLGNWVRHNRAYLDEQLLAHGGVLFRGFDVGTVSEFDEFVQAFTPDLMDYLDQHTPRTRLSGNIYTSTEYPADHHVPFHSENSKNHVWPMRLWFCCVKSAERGGETPIADNRKVFAAVPPAVRERFMEKQVMYVRNFGDGLGLPWQTVFQTSDKSEVEAYCREAGLEYQWKDGDRLRTRHVCQAVARHPQTGELVWFNQAHLFHVSTLAPEARESLLSLFKEEELPSNAYYGDGSKIEDSVIGEINEAYRQAAVSFPWQERDILMLDNMLVAHSRKPYSGSRRVLVAMAEPHGRQDS